FSDLRKPLFYFLELSDIKSRIFQKKMSTFVLVQTAKLIIMKQLNALKKALLLILSLTIGIAYSQITTFNYTGGMQTYTVPGGVTSIQIEAWGAQGGGSKPCTGPLEEDGGLGGYSIGNLAVTPGQILN